MTYLDLLQNTWSFLRHPNYYKDKFTFFLSSSIRMSGKSIIFDNAKLQKSNFYKNKRLLKIDDVDYNKILVSKKDHMAQISHLNI